jgi:hypothetical protein
MRPTTRLLVLAALAPTFAVTKSTQADLYLVGAQEYWASADGTVTGGAWQFSTNSSTGHASMPISDGTTPDIDGLAISFLLADGDNVFTYSYGGTGFPGLNLFFNSTVISFNPSAGPDIAGDLTIYAPVGSPTFGVPAAGTTILSYGAHDLTAHTASANGASSLLLDNRVISVTAFHPNVSPGVSTFTLNIAAVPEVSAVLMGGITSAVVLTTACWRRLRRAVEPFAANL